MITIKNLHTKITDTLFEANNSTRGSLALVDMLTPIIEDFRFKINSLEKKNEITEKLQSENTALKRKVGILELEKEYLDIQLSIQLKPETFSTLIIKAKSVEAKLTRLKAEQL